MTQKCDWTLFNRVFGGGLLRRISDDTMANIFAEAIFYGWNAIFLQRNISKSWLNNQIVFICVWMQSFCIKYTIYLHFHELQLQYYGFANYCKIFTKIMHDFWNILPHKLYTKPIQEFCNHFQNFSVYLQNNTELLQKICNPFQKFGVSWQNITKPMQNFCTVIKNFCVRMQKSCEEWHH